jgi:hypothetical protein
VSQLAQERQLQGVVRASALCATRNCDVARERCPLIIRQRATRKDFRCFYDDAQRRDHAARLVDAARSTIDLVYNAIGGGKFWNDPLTDCETPLADLDSAIAALNRVH